MTNIENYSDIVYDCDLLDEMVCSICKRKVLDINTIIIYVDNNKQQCCDICSISIKNKINNKKIIEFKAIRSSDVYNRYNSKLLKMCYNFTNKEEKKIKEKCYDIEDNLLYEGDLNYSGTTKVELILSTITWGQYNNLSKNTEFVISISNRKFSYVKCENIVLNFLGISCIEPEFSWLEKSTIHDKRMDGNYYKNNDKTYWNNQFGYKIFLKFSNKFAAYVTLYYIDKIIKENQIESNEDIFELLQNNHCAINKLSKFNSLPTDAYDIILSYLLNKYDYGESKNI